MSYSFSQMPSSSAFQVFFSALAVAANAPRIVSRSQYWYDALEDNLADRSAKFYTSASISGLQPELGSKTWLAYVGCVVPGSAFDPWFSFRPRHMQHKTCFCEQSAFSSAQLPFG